MKGSWTLWLASSAALLWAATTVFALDSVLVLLLPSVLVATAVTAGLMGFVALMGGSIIRKDGEPMSNRDWITAPALYFALAFDVAVVVQLVMLVGRRL